MGEQIEIAAVHPWLTADEAYEVLREFERHVRPGGAIGRVGMELEADGGWVSSWSMELQCGVVRWSQHRELDDVNRRALLRRRDGDPVEVEWEWRVEEDLCGCEISFECEVDLGGEYTSALFARALRTTILAELRRLFGPQLRAARPASRQVAVAGI